MPNRNRNLSGDAEKFRKIAEGEINQTFSLVLKSSKSLLVTHGKQVLDDATLQEALRLADEKQLSELFGLLRGSASRFVGKVDTTAYWAWIDAAGSFFDATGVSWPYMTMSGRKSNLAFSQQCASQVCGVTGTVH